MTQFDTDRRRLAPGLLAELSAGTAHYQWHGPETGRPMVLVHGFSTPSFVWCGILPALTGAGYRVLSYDHFGRGWSDRPKADYSLGFHRQQLCDLLEDQQITAPIHLVGYSMGGLIGADFASRFAESVERLFMIAPAGLGTEVAGIPAALRWPLIDPLLAETVMKRRLVADMQKPQNQGRALPDLAERYAEQMRYPGYMRALRATILNFNLGAAPEIYQRLAKPGMPVAALWGSADTVTPPSGAELLRQTVPRAVAEIADGPSHAITYAEPDLVAERIIAFGAG